MEILWWSLFIDEYAIHFAYFVVEDLNIAVYHSSSIVHSMAI